MTFPRYLILAVCALSLSACGQDNPTLSTTRSQQNAAEPNPLHTVAEGAGDAVHADHSEHEHDDHADHDHPAHEDHEDHHDHDHEDHAHAH